MKTLFAYTENNPDQPTYPGFVNISDDGEYVYVSVRSQPTVREGAFVCSYRADAGPGRCVAGDQNCNNYCNMAPEKGPMQDSPKPCLQVFEGVNSSFAVPKSAFILAECAAQGGE